MAPKIVFNAPQDYDLPDIDLLSLIFDSPECGSTDNTVLHVEAACPENSLTRSQVRYYTQRIAYILRSQYGVGTRDPGKDVVVCISSGQVLVPCAFFGTVAAAGVFSSASNSFTAHELARQLRQGPATVLVTSSDCEQVARKAADTAGLSHDRILVLESTGGRRQLFNNSREDLLVSEKADTELLEWEVIKDRTTLERRTACLLYSSGTTGEPKGVILTHRNMSSYALIHRYLHRDYESRRRALDPNFSYKCRTLAHLPTAHIAGVQGYLIHPAMIGGTVYWMPKFNFSHFLDYNKQFAITWFFTVPPIYLQIAQNPHAKDYFKAMVHAVTGAAPMGPDLTARAEAVLGCHISQTWGLSETTGGITAQPWEVKDTTGSVSLIAPNFKIRLVDDDEIDVEDGQEGEFITQSPTVTPGYWGNSTEATTNAFTRCKQWFKTGDIGVRRNGKFYIIDRKKELIKYKGVQVAPAELETFLLTHPLIKDAAVIGVPDLKIEGNEVPRAYVVADESKIGADEIRQFVRDHLASHKQLRGGIVYRKSIPKSANGKILRRELRQLAKKEFNSARL